MSAPTHAPHSRALAASWRVLHLVRKLNYVYAAGITAILAALLIAPDRTMTMLGVSEDADRSAIYLAMRIIPVLGLIGAAVTDRILARIIAIVATVREGDPFVAPNAGRLEDIAWATLLLELIYLLVGAVASAASRPEQPLDLDWSFSITPWVSVLLLFVLARVFAYGTRLRDDLDGVV
jgi:hypothetical protein